MEVYVDDMRVKSREAKTHLADLQEAFDTLRRYKMKLNLVKCLFRVSLGKFLGFMVSQWEIEANTEKVKVILDIRGVQKIEEPKKLLPTDWTGAKILVWFRLSSVLVLLYKKSKISIRFLVANFNTPNWPNRTKIYYYIIFYIKYIIFCKYLTLTLWDTLWLF